MPRGEHFKKKNVELEPLPIISEFDNEDIEELESSCNGQCECVQCEKQTEDYKFVPEKCDSDCTIPGFKLQFVSTSTPKCTHNYRVLDIKKSQISDDSLPTTWKEVIRFYCTECLGIETITVNEIISNNRPDWF